MKLTVRLFGAPLLALCFTFFMVPIWLLKIIISFNSLSLTETNRTIAALVAHVGRQSSNLPVLIQLLGYGDNGLRQAWREYCPDMSQEMLDSLLDWLKGKPEWAFVFFDHRCINVLRRSHDSRDAGPFDVHGVLLPLSLDPAYSSSPEKLEIYEKTDPRGHWWSYFVQTAAWKTVLQQSMHPYCNGPVFRVGMMDFLYSGSPDRFEPFKGILSATSDDTLGAIFAIYILIGLRVRFSHENVSVVFENFRSMVESKPTFEFHRQIIDHCLCSWTGQECPPGTDFDSLMARASSNAKLNPGIESRVFLKTLVLLVFESHESTVQTREGLASQLRPILARLDDFDLSEFLWHTHLLQKFAEKPMFVQMILAEESFRLRLLRIAPFRTDKWSSLLLYTRDGIAYFRRWMLRYPDAISWESLLNAQSDDDLLSTISTLDWRGGLVFNLLHGLPVRQKLQSLLQTILADPQGPFQSFSFGQRRRIWISLSAGPPCRWMTPAFAQALVLVLRLRLHHDDPMDQSKDANDDDDDGVIQYDLCDDVLELLDVPFWRRQLSFFIRPLKIVYPPWKNENTRSRPCGIDS